MTFKKKLDRIIRNNDSLLCVGLDSDIEKIPGKKTQFLFNKSIIEATYDMVCSYKLNIAFYESIGLKGLQQLKLTTKYLKDKYPEIPVIIDAKRGDIGNTNRGYVQFLFNILEADAVTVNPYLGEEAMGPFLEMKDKGIFVLCRTSNPGAGEFQDLPVKGKPLYMAIAKNVSEKWNKNKNCFLVVGATYPDELKQVRKIVGGEMTILVPGVGVQGGDLEATLSAGLSKNKKGLIINSSRGIIFSKNPRSEAIKLKDEINKYRV